MPWAWIAVTGLAVATATGIAILVRTGWLQSRTMEKCVGLSVVLHAVLGILATFVGGWMPASWGTRDEGRMTMVVVVADDPGDEEVITDSVEASPRDEAPRKDPAGMDAALATESPPPLVPLATNEAPAPPADVVPLLDADDDARGEARGTEQPTETAPSTASKAVAAGVPAVYADRVGSRRAAAAMARGGSHETEQAVQAAIEWLARNQSSDGLWNAARHGAGTAAGTAGQHRPEVGAKSDHGVTGLALLAFLGAGNTHRVGPYASTVARGIAALTESQRPDGSLAGGAEFFAALYCHGMATIAVAECASMSGDASLIPVLDRAIRHTLAMQHPQTGGWRYAAGDRGDTSQLGWQVMALYSARNAGLSGFEMAESRARSFLMSVSSGSAGGLACYRPGERPSMAMTSESLFCRFLLGMPADHPATSEAIAVLASSAPGSSVYDIYAWYYATLASFHAGGPQWDIWNARLQAVLLPLQHRSGGSLAGSWEPDRVWGRHGGRVYATALAALTLEVYYRYQPLHGQPPRMAATPR
jgi:uncharacterized membrane protein YeaQ/YmgE (transglycosylase-associated protein family)